MTDQPKEPKLAAPERCEAHPKYAAKRQPRVGCLPCWGIWRKRNATQKRIVLGEGRMRYSMSKALILDEMTATGHVRNMVDWPDLTGDPRVRLVLEVID